MIKRTPIKERLLSKYVTDPETGCWNWTASGVQNGYGTIGTGGRHGKALSHRVSYQLHCGPIPPGLCVLHRCDNRKCINPDHLFLGTVADNQQDMKRKGRAAKPNARLTPAEVEAIRFLWNAFPTTHKILARHYGVGLMTVGNIVRGTTWCTA